MKQKITAFRMAHPYIHIDMIAITCGLALFLYFIVTARIGIGLPDELYHYSIPFRILHGDAFLVHDWSIEQIAQLMNIAPFFLFVKMTGSTEGIVLFSRFLFIFVDACFYAYMYLKLRKRLGVWAVLSSFLFCAMLPPTGLCLNYYTIGPMAMMQLCLMLFLDAQKKSALKLFAAGFVWGVAILAEPMTFLVCVLFILVVIARSASKKRLFESCSFFLSPRSLGWLALGAFMVQLLFIAVIYVTGGNDLVMDTIPYFLGNSGYSGSSLFDFWKIPDVIICYGMPGLLCWLLSFGMAVYYAYRYRKNEKEMVTK